MLKSNGGEEDKPIGYYTKRLIFHFDQYLKNELIKDLLVFPYLQTINGLRDGHPSSSSYGNICLQLDQPTDFVYWYSSEKLTVRFNKICHHLKSLQVYLTRISMDIIHSPPSQQDQHLKSIHMEYIGRSNIFGTSLNISINKLVLSTTTAPLVNLIKLKIDFECLPPVSGFGYTGYVIDEHTFESIHQSCPLLESLSVENFYMNISNDYLHHDLNSIVPAYHLNNMDINGNFHDQHCFQYFTNKFPRLESLSLYVNVDELTSEEIKPITIAILNMLLQSSLLKRLTYKKKKNDVQVWSCYQFFIWLHQYSNQLKHLDYPFPLTEYECINVDGTNSMINIYNNNNNIKPLPPLPQQYMFLSHLTSLSIYINYAFDLVFSYLQENINTFIVSTSLKKLEMRDHYDGKISYIRLYDWLDIFPNLEFFSTLQCTGSLIDNSDFLMNTKRIIFAKKIIVDRIICIN